MRTVERSIKVFQLTQQQIRTQFNVWYENSDIGLQTRDFYWNDDPIVNSKLKVLAFSLFKLIKGYR